MRPRATFLGDWVGASLALGLILLGITGQEAKAEIINLDKANVAFTGGPPFEQVVKTNPTPTSVQFVFTALGGASDLLGSFAFNTNVALTAADFTTVPSGWTPTATQQVDGFGVFSWDVGSSANADRVHSGTITITGLTTTEANLANFDIANSSGNLFASHYFQGALTGFVSGGTVVPEPSTLAIAGLGALGFIGYGMRRRPKK